jgi:putative transposase
VVKGYKYRIYPTDEQKQYFEKSFGCIRYIYNWGLERKLAEYEATKKSLSYFELQKELTIIRRELTWLQEVGSDSLQYSLRHLDNAFTNFFRKHTNFPKFKSKHHCRNSFSTYQATHIDFNNYLLSIPKCKNIKVKVSRKFEGKFTGCTISKASSGRYFVSFRVDNSSDFPAKPKPQESETIGVDLGLKHFAILSSGEKLANPRFLRNSEIRLKVMQRRLSRKQKKGSNRNKARIKVASYHEHITNQRNDFLHKLTSRLVAENQSIAVENLAVSNMQKNHSLAKSIADASWYEFRRQLIYKCDWYGKNLLVIGQFEPSSKICSCGSINTSLTLADRIWTCENCGTTHDRDILAANNIKHFAYAPSGRRGEPVESLA